MKQFVRVIELIADIGGYVPGWLVPLMMLLVFVEVFMRYVVGQPLMVADEYAGYMLVAISFLGLAYTWKEKGHVRITALIERLPVKISNWFRLVGLVLVLAFVLELIYFSYFYMARSFKLHMASDTWIRTPLQIPQMALPIGFVILALLIIIDIARAITIIRLGKSVEEEAR